MDYYSISFDYSFSSGLGCYEHSRYLREVSLKINLTGSSDEKIQEIGSCKFFILNLDQAYDAPYSIFYIIDSHSEYAARHFFNIIDYRKADFKSNLYKHYNHDITNSNVCLIVHVELLPEFRGYGIAAKAIKDIIFQYSSSCGIFAIQPYPLQFEPEYKREQNQHLKLDNFEHNERKAFRKLTDYYKSIGFEPVRGVKDLLLYNPALKNEKLDVIDLEECPEFPDSVFQSIEKTPEAE